jgi:MFS family permease
MPIDSSLAAAGRTRGRAATLFGALHLELWPMGALSIGLYAMAGLLVPLQAQALGLAADEIGYVAGAAALLSTLFAIPCGRACDRYGARAATAAFALLAAAATIVTAFATSFAALVVLQLVAGFARAACWMGAQAYVAALGAGGDGKRRTVAFSFAAMAGPLVTIAATGAIARFLGYGGAILVTGCAYGLLVVAILIVPPAPPPAIQPPAPLRALLAMPGMKRVLLANFLRFASSIARLTFFPLYLAGLGFSITAIAAIVTLGNIVATAIVPAAAPLLARLGAARLLDLALMLCLGALALTPLASGVAALGFLSILWGVGMGVSLPALLQETATVAGSGRIGLATGFRQTISEGASLICPVLLGAVSQQAGVGSGLGIVTGALLAAAILAACSRVPRRGEAL